MDVWCLGVLFYVGLTNKHPFGLEENKEYFQKLKSNEITFSFIENNETQNNLKEISDLIREMLNSDPCKRINAGNITKHKLIRFNLGLRSPVN